jgi:hypothetical protein
MTVKHWFIHAILAVRSTFHHMHRARSQVAVQQGKIRDVGTSHQLQ